MIGRGAFLCLEHLHQKEKISLSKARFWKRREKALGFQKTVKGEERENCSPKISMCSN
jgi:hypothetical protein